MPLITIAQKGSTASGFEAELIIENTRFAIQVSDPFVGDVQQEKWLEWYFEEWIRFPFTNTVRAEKAAKSVRQYGEALFEQVFGHRNAYGAFQAVSGNLGALNVEIMGEPEFQALHWEAMWESDQPHPLVVNCMMSRRRLSGSFARVLVQESPVLNLLVVTARPDEEKDVGYRTISRPLVEAISNANLRVNVEMVRPGTYEAFARHLEGKQSFYHIVHFDLHGGLMGYEDFQKYVHAQTDGYTFQRGYGLPNLPRYEGVQAFLFFEAEAAGQAVPVTAQEMADRLKQSGIPVCILNACQSGKQVRSSAPQTESVGAHGSTPSSTQNDASSPATGTIDERETSLGARLMDAGMQMVVAMGYSVTVSAAALLLKQLYERLFAEESLPEAVRRGRKELFERKQRRVYYNQMVDLEDWLLPVVYANQAVDFRLRPMSFVEEESYFTKQTTQYRFGGAEFKTEYGFVGRDLDILKLEKRLLQHNVLLVQGMGGTGKTTLLRYLQDWWVRTRFVDEVFYFGYDKQAWTLTQILHSIGQAIYPDAEQRMFHAMPIEAQMGKLVQTLRGRRYGLMLDNLESVTGQALAIRHTLSAQEQGQVQQFLERLSGGQTLAILGSRSPEEWLRGAYGQNCYELRGLDSQARTELAQKVLERNVSDGGRRAALLKEPDFKRLMTVLAGYPLAIEVVLANLAQQSVADVLAGLNAADVNLDREGSKTESILKCVEYSHSNLSPDAQKLLLCLAPFSGVIMQKYLPQYVGILKTLEPFKNYPFEQFKEAVQEAINWGLLSPHESGLPSLLMIQPVFPYFLKTKLEMQTVEIQAALRQGFKIHYQGMQGAYEPLMSAKDPQKKAGGLFLCKVEYENFYYALKICLKRQESVDIFFYLYTFLTLTNNTQDRLRLAEFVCEQHKHYLSEIRVGEIGLNIALSLGRLANCYLEMKDFSQAKTYYGEKISLLEQLENIAVKQKLLHLAGTYHQMGRVMEGFREFDEARQSYRKALSIKIEYDYLHSQASTYHQLGVVAQELKEYEEARCNYQKALAIYVEYDDRAEQAGTYHQLGTIAEEQGKLRKARRNYRKALSIKIAYGDFPSQCGTYNNLGSVARRLRNFNEARRNYQKALDICINHRVRSYEGVIYYNFGNFAQKLREYDEAQRSYQKALNIFIEDSDYHFQKNTYYELGCIAQKLRDFHKAQHNYQEALKICIDYGTPLSQCGIYCDLGSVAQKLQDYEKARCNYQAALNICIDYDRLSQGRIYGLLATLAEDEQNLPEVVTNSLKALEIFVEFQDYDSISVTGQILTQVYQTTQDPELLSAISQILGMSEEQVQEWFEA
jgi:tetratricopeptide (TPR) repeat protein